MSIKYAEFSVKPSEVELAADGKWVVLNRSINKEQRTDDNGTYSVWAAEQVAFNLPYGRIETVASIEANFDAWFSYGAAWAQEKAPTIEERLEAIEETLVAVLGGE
jgi:hypothetical protein